MTNHGKEPDLCADSRNVDEKRMRIALFGLFGIENLGNECTLQAMLHNVRLHKSDADFFCISYEPQDTEQRHNIAAVPISARHARVQTRRQTLGKGRLSRMVRIAFVRIPQELRDWIRIFRILRRTDLMLMTGTGMLTDFSETAFGYPYDIFRWVLAARLARCKVRFVGIGVGPIYERLSRWFVKTALANADYRSFRDTFSKDRLQKMDIDVSRDPVYPDLAFSLPPKLFARPSCSSARSVVGVGVIKIFDPRAQGVENEEAYYKAYLAKTATLVSWLVQQGYDVRILHGDVRHDTEVRFDLRSLLKEQGLRYADSRIYDDDIESVNGLLVQIAECDLVISPRYHNLLLALMLNKPVYSLSYDPKNDALLADVGLGRLCQPLEKWDVERVTEQVIEMDEILHTLGVPLPKKTAEYRARLDQQYTQILADI